MNMQARHSRKDSDDLSKLLVGHDDANLEFGGGQSQMDPSLTEPSLSYRQPKTSFTSFRAFLSRCNSKTYCIDNFLLRVTRVYVHPAVSSLVLFFAILIPVVLALVVVIPDCNNGDCLVIDKSIESFEIPGHISSERNDMVEVAGSHSHTQKKLPNLRRKRFARALDEKPTEKTSYQTKPRWRLELVYLAIGDDDLNMFTKERLETVHAIDQSLMSQQGFNDYCWKWKEARADPFLDDHCVPPISLINFFYPSRSEFLKKEIFDGQGRNEDGTVIKNLTETSIQNTLKLLLTKTFTYWFVDDSFSKDNLKSRFLRAEMKFGSPLKPDGTNRKERDRYENFLKSYIEAMKKMSTDKVRLLYGGTDVFDYEVNKTLWADIKLAVFTIAFVGIFVLIFTRLSLFLTFFGIISIVTPLFVAYFFFRHVFQVPSLGILSGISAFIIIGIGVDDVFVFVNTFCQAHSARSLESRMLHTICTAGKATFFTSFTTAMAFFANCFSKMPAIRDFGLFMGLIVGSCWFTVFFTIPPALTLWHRYISKWEVLIYKMIFGKLNCALGSGRSDLPGDILQFLSGNERSYSQQASWSSASQVMELADRSLSQEDDTSLINLDSSSPNSQSPSPSSSDTDLTMFDDPNGTFDQQAPLVHRRSFQSRQGLPHQSHSSSCCRCRCGLQSFLYYWLAVPIQKCRYIVLVLFILILGVSIGFDSQIRPSTKPPAFFKESTNLQQLIELKYNMSSESLDTNDIAADQLVNEFQQSNDIDNPTPATKKLMVTTQSNSPISESTPALKTPDTSGDKKKGDGIVKPPNSNTTPIPKGKTLKPTTASLQKKTSSSSPTKKPAVHSTKKPRTERKFTPTQKANKDKPLTKKTESNEGGSGNDIHSPTAIGTPITPPLCPGGCKPVPKPIVASSAVIFVILGLSKIDRSMIRREHVIEKKGEVIPDFSFTKLVSERSKFVSAACRLCKMISNNHELVREGGADCFPSWMWDFFLDDISINGHSSVFYKDCFNLTKPTFSSGSSQAKMYYMDVKNPYGNKTYWMKMAFESKIFKGKSSHEKVEDFEKWDSFLKDIISSPSFPEGFKSIFQTNQEWVNVFIEVVAVNSAIYGTVFSLMLCVFSVAVFTANACLTFIVMVTIVGVLTTVVGIFYLLSWHLGAVEAISLSILVGTSVDYCVHLVEGYIMAGNCIPQNLSSSKEIRGWRTRAAVSHIGTAILSSAITTVVASIPLCMTVIQLFAKFGQILAINTAVSIFFTLTICVALLCIMAPVKFRASLITSAKALVVVVVVCGLGTLALYSVTLKVNIPGPSGEPIHF